MIGLRRTKRANFLSLQEPSGMCVPTYVQKHSYSSLNVPFTFLFRLVLSMQLLSACNPGTEDGRQAGHNGGEARGHAEEAHHDGSPDRHPAKLQGLPKRLLVMSPSPFDAVASESMAHVGGRGCRGFGGGLAGRQENPRMVLYLTIKSLAFRI